MSPSSTSSAWSASTQASPSWSDGGLISLVEGDYRHLGRTGTAGAKVALRRLAARSIDLFIANNPPAEELPGRDPEGAPLANRHRLVAGGPADRPALHGCRPA